MKLAKIENGVVVNIVKVSPDNIPAWASDWPEATEETQVGGGYDGQTWTPAPEPTAGELAAQLEALKDAIIARFDQPTSIDKVMLKISFLQENRIRALEGKQPITAQQFKDWVRTQID